MKIAINSPVCFPPNQISAVGWKIITWNGELPYPLPASTAKTEDAR